MSYDGGTSNATCHLGAVCAVCINLRSLVVIYDY